MSTGSQTRTQRESAISQTQRDDRPSTRPLSDSAPGIWFHNDLDGSRQESANNLLGRCHAHARNETHPSNTRLHYTQQVTQSIPADVLWYVLPHVMIDTRFRKYGALLPHIQALLQQQSRHDGTTIIDMTAGLPPGTAQGRHDLSTFWSPLSQQLHYGVIRLCNLGIRHPQNDRPPRASFKLLTQQKLPDLSTC